MKAVHARAYDIRKVRTRQVCEIKLEVPIECYSELVAFLDERDVLVTIAPEKVGPYGLVGGESQPEPAKPEPRKGGELSRFAAMLCEDENFWNFLPSCFRCTVQNADDAAAVVREACGISSRADLDHNPEAAKLFHELIRKPYWSFNEKQTEQLRQGF